MKFNTIEEAIIDIKNGKNHLILKSFSGFGSSKSQVKTSSEKPSIKLGTAELNSLVDSEGILDENYASKKRNVTNLRESEVLPDSKKLQTEDSEPFVDFNRLD